MAEKKEEEKKDEKKADQPKDEIKEAILKSSIKKFYAESSSIGRKKMDVEDKKLHELIRRWEITITEMEISTKEKMFSPFIQGIIGGSFQKEYCIAEGKKIISEKGEKGVSFRTNVISNIKKEEVKTFKTTVTTEIRSSYVDIMTQFLHLELWNSNRFLLNTFIDYQSIPLLDIISGNVIQEVTFNQKLDSDEPEKPFAQLRFSILFQEIWDFYITFKDWSATNMVDGTKLDGKNANKEDEIEAAACIKLTHETNTSSKSILSDVCPTLEKAVWGTIKGGLHYRGTFSDLEQTKLTIDIYDNNITPSLRGKKTVTLEGSLFNNFVKTDISLSNLPTKKAISTERKSQVQGVISFGNYPKYKQIGKNEVLKCNETYLVIDIVQLEGMSDLMVFGNSWYVTVECKGETKKTKLLSGRCTFNFNQKFYFLLPISNELQKRYQSNPSQCEEEYIKALRQNLGPMSVAMIDLWSISGGIIDHVGNCQFNISEIINGKYDDFRSPFKNDIKQFYSCKYCDCSKLLKSAKSKNSKVHLKFRGYFIPNLPPNVPLGDYPEGPNVMHQLYTSNYSKCDSTWNDYVNQLRGITDKGRTYTYQAKDQFDRPFLKTRFLSAITSPDMSNLGKRMDHKIRTLQEIHHFVSCFPYTFESVDNVWSSPDFFLSIMRGDNEEHIILLACMFLGCTIESSEDLKCIPDSLEDNEMESNIRLQAIINYLNTKNQTPIANAEENEPKKEILNVEVKEDKKKKDEGKEKCMEGRVFICQGLTKTKKQTMWVMTIDKSFKTVTFWTLYPTMETYTLRGRITDSIKMKSFIFGENKQNEGDVALPNNEPPPLVKDDISLNQDHISLNFDKLDCIDKSFDSKNMDNNESKQEENMENVEAKKKENTKETKINLKEIYAFKDENGAQINDGFGPGKEFPFETIDVIFSEKNVYLNIKSPDPLKIKYDIFEPEDWYPFINRDIVPIAKDKNFPIIPPFYNQRSFEQAYNDQFINKTLQNITKEIKSSIRAMRTSENKKTKWKMLDHDLKSGFEQILDNLEHYSCRRVDQLKIDDDFCQPAILIKLGMPAKYKFEYIGIFSSTLDSERIKKIISHSKEINKFLNADFPTLKFAILGKIFSYPNRVVSVRFILGQFTKEETKQKQDKDKPKESETYRESKYMK